MTDSQREKKRYIGLIAKIIATIRYQYHWADNNTGRNLTIQRVPKNTANFVKPMSITSKFFVFVFTHVTDSINIHYKTYIVILSPTGQGRLEASNSMNPVN